MRFDIRLFATCADDARAGRLSAALVEALASFVPEVEMTPRRYWKMPELYEFSFRLYLAAPSAFDRLVALQPLGWLHGDGELPRSSVWNRQDGVAFLAPEVTWAEVQLYREPDDDEPLVEGMGPQHADGTPCVAGTRSVPESFTPCCAIFGAHLDTCEYDVRYEWWPDQRFWVIAIAASAGGGGVWIGHCPHCGARLVPSSERAEDDGDGAAGQVGRWMRL